MSSKAFIKRKKNAFFFSFYLVSDSGYWKQFYFWVNVFLLDKKYREFGYEIHFEVLRILVAALNFARGT